MSTIINWFNRMVQLICHRTVHFRQKGDNAPYDVKMYALSADRTTSSPTTCPTIIGSWQATPPVRTAGTFVWERIQHYTKDGVLESTSYTRLTGDTGAGYKAIVYRNNFTESQWNTYGTVDHEEAWSDTSSTRGECTIGDLFTVVGTDTDKGYYHVATYVCDNSSGNLHGRCISHQITKNGADGADGKDGDNAPYDVTTYALSANSTTASSTTAPTITGSWQSVPPARQVGTFVWSRIQHYDKDGNLVSTIYVRHTGDTGADGADGANGAHGLWYEYAGVWGEDISSVTNTSNLGWWVKYGTKDYMSLVEGENTTTPGTDPTKWEEITGERKYYIAKAFFGDYANFGSAIINGDWMITKNGTIKTFNTSDGSTTTTEYNDGATKDGVPAYTLFDPASPKGEKIWYSRGEIKSKSISISGLTSGRLYVIHIIEHGYSWDSYTTYELLNSAGTVIASGTVGSATSHNASDGFTEDNTIEVTADGGSYTLNLVTTKVTSRVAPTDYLIQSNMIMVYANPVSPFIPKYALNMKTGEIWHGKTHVEGSISADVLYMKQLVITRSGGLIETDWGIGGFTLNVNPEAHKCKTYIINDTAITGDLIIMLPLASLYDGLELDFVVKTIGDDAKAYLNFCDSNLWCQDTSSTTRVLEKRVAKVVDAAVIDDGLYELQPQVLVSIRAINGEWWVVNGDYQPSCSGDSYEYCATAMGDYSVSLSDGNRQFILIKDLTGDAVITLPSPASHDGAELKLFFKQTSNEFCNVRASSNIICDGTTLTNDFEMNVGVGMVLKAMGGIWYIMQC